MSRTEIPLAEDLLATSYEPASAPSSVPRWPTVLALVGAIASLVLTYLAWRAAIPAQIKLFSILGYLLGALGVTVFWNVQRAYVNRAATNRQRVQPIFGADPQLLSRIAMIIGLLSGLTAAFLLAAEVARR